MTAMVHNRQCGSKSCATHRQGDASRRGATDQPAMYDAVPASTATIATLPATAEDARWRVVARTAFPFLVVGGAWEIVAHLGIFPPRLFPPLEAVGSALVRLTIAGILPHHALDTVVRLLAGFTL